MIHKRASNRDTLSLTARELVGLVSHTLSQVHGLERFLRHLMSLRRANTTVNQRQLDVVQRRGAREQIERLKYETDFLIANARKLVVVHLRDVLTVEPVFTLTRSIETADQIHQGRLAGTGWTDDRDVLATRDIKRHSVQRVNFL